MKRQASESNNVASVFTNVMNDCQFGFVKLSMLINTKLTLRKSKGNRDVVAQNFSGTI